MNNEKTFTKNELFRKHAPDYNFELNADALIWTCLRDGHIKKVGDDAYKYIEEIDYKTFQITVRETHNATYEIKAASAELAQELCLRDVGIDTKLTNRRLIDGTILEVSEVES